MRRAQVPQERTLAGCLKTPQHNRHHGANNHSDTSDSTPPAKQQRQRNRRDNNANATGETTTPTRQGRDQRRRRQDEQPGYNKTQNHQRARQQTQEAARASAQQQNTKSKIYIYIYQPVLLSNQHSIPSFTHTILYPHFPQHSIKVGFYRKKQTADTMSRTKRSS